MVPSAALPNTTRAQSRTAHLLLIAVAILWGMTFPLAKAALGQASPLLFNLVRMILAAALLFAVNGRRLSGLTRSQWKLCAAAGVLLSFGYEFQTAGLARTTPSKSAFLTGLVVVLVPLLSALPGIRVPGAPRPHRLAFAGAVLAFAGLVLLTSQPGAGWALLAGMHAGEWLTLACAFAFAFHLLLLARAAGTVDARVLGTLQIAVAAVVMLFLLPLERHPFLNPTPTVLWALGITSVFATAAAFTIQSWAQAHVPPTHTALIFTLEPVFAGLASLVFLGEHLGPRGISGAVLILGGIILAELGPTAVIQAGILPLEP